MRYRVLDSNGDYVFGQGVGEFLVDSPDAVAQAIETRLQLGTNEWFLDLSEGTPYLEEILGMGKSVTADAAIRDRILGTPNVLSIDQYLSSLDSRRNLTVTCKVSTTFGPLDFTTQL